jgi:hypothetical protein
MDPESVKQLKQFVDVVTRHSAILVRFDECDIKTCKRLGLPVPIAYDPPAVLAEGLELLDPARHSVLKNIVCVSNHHKKLAGIACNLLQMGVCIVRPKRS